MLLLAKLPTPDVVEFQLADADARFHAEHGPERGWQPTEHEHYMAVIADVHKRFGKQVAS